jgi:predicted CopG family antitoxin
MHMTDNRRNISVSPETYEKLKGFGRFGESFDDLLNRLMDAVPDSKPSKKLVEAKVIRR